ncbi:Dihydropteroate synthase [Zhongshania aliphaticivorans]|uniref:Dihydropteroate synthase n=1 Tax=Zhongshania aliphaticivorans TaxID=1470434 RepID=A0A5S9MWD0_9GAMM|nr:dihydropteroate synthase [Zhongshania aliphaticivorans]CAA0081605.1 Dihydropteroate synthase [Zhongshania aliphaticivorans]CAA0084895.1 Dihydropteroate synthase [Zhongshania aliphaticivorans]
MTPLLSSPSPQLRCGARLLDLSEPHVMAIINVTPDSFSDGGDYHAGGLLLDKVLRRVEEACAQGATLIDIGGESTRPGAQAVGVDEECERVLPVVEAIAQRFDVVVSVDTSTPEVMRGAASLGAGLINDVRALLRPGAESVAAANGLPVCLMHMHGEPGSMQRNPEYQNVFDEVSAFLNDRILACEAMGIARDRFLIDPGFGFGKTVAHNLELFRRLPSFVEMGFPVLVGLSRKSMLGAITGRGVDDRVAASVAMAVMAVERGAHIVRVHDVKETVDAVKMTAAVMFEKRAND